MSLVMFGNLDPKARPNLNKVGLLTIFQFFCKPGQLVLIA